MLPSYRCLTFDLNLLNCLGQFLINRHMDLQGLSRLDIYISFKWNFLLLVFLEHEHIDSFLNEMTHQTEDLTGGKTFFCGICQKNSKAKQDIERHIETHHIQTNPFQCGICGYVSKSRRYFKVHLRSHKTR